MKVAILFSGLVRTLELTWPITQQHFGPYQPDFYYYLNEPEKEQLVVGLLHPKAIVAEPDPVLPEHDYVLRKEIGVRNLQSDLRQLYGMMRVNQLCRSSGIQYDWVIRLRPDVEITLPPEPLETLDPAFIYVPRVNNWYGYSDRIGIGPQRLMNIYMERYTDHHAYLSGGGYHHMETFLAWHLRHHRVSIARTRTLFNLLRMDGSRDRPYSSLAWGDVP